MDMDNLTPEIGGMIDASSEQVSQARVRGAPTKLGPLSMDLKGLMIAPLGVIIVIPGFFVPAGLPLFLALGTLAILMGVNKVSESKTRTCVCPFCGEEGALTGGAWEYKCPACLETSEKKRAYLVPEKD